MPRPEGIYAPTTPMIDIRSVPLRLQRKMLLDYGYMYNPTTVDQNVFARTSEQTFTLSRQFEN